MANYETIATFTLTDANGQEAQMRVRTYTDDTATVADVVTAVNGLGAAIGNPGVLSNAKVTKVSAGIEILRAQTTPGAPNPPIDAWFASVSDKAVLEFGNSNGVTALSSIPAPIEGLFHAPPADLNVNPANAAVAAYIAAYEAYARDASLTFMNLYLGGTYRGRRRPSRAGRM